MGCINCHDCGYPHLDLGAFARTEHRNHLCGNCGRGKRRASTFTYQDDDYLVDDTFGSVVYQGETLQERVLFDAMVASTIN